MKSQIFNLIILDESGSMDCVTKQTISGCNETINTIRATQQEFNETQEHFVSIFVFQGAGTRPSRYLCKNTPIDQVKHITEKDYEPCGNTPLYDAVGSTLTDLKATTTALDDATGSVTIITDGYENSSRHYDLQHVARMISALTEMGWNFNFIGANIDVNRVSASLSIKNAMAFTQDDRGTQEMFEKERMSRKAYYKRFNESAQWGEIDKANMTPEEIEVVMEKRREMRRNANEDYFSNV